MIILFLSISSGILLAETLSVFSWNGILQSVERTVGPSVSTVDKASSNRLTFWKTTLHSLCERFIMVSDANGFEVFIDTP